MGRMLFRKVCRLFDIAAVFIFMNLLQRCSFKSIKPLTQFLPNDVQPGAWIFFTSLYESSIIKVKHTPAASPVCFHSEFQASLRLENHSQVSRKFITGWKPIKIEKKRWGWIFVEGLPSSAAAAAAIG